LDEGPEICVDDAKELEHSLENDFDLISSGYVVLYT
jgi:hypothetical protein